MEPANENSQVSGYSQIHGMMLKYPDDKTTDEEMRELSLQTPAHHYMMESDAQHQTTPISFQEILSPLGAVSPSKCYIPDGQNTQLSQIVHRKTSQLPDGSPGIRLHIPYLEEFFDTMWYLNCNDMYGLYAISDTIFKEVPFFAQL